MCGICQHTCYNRKNIFHIPVNFSMINSHNKELCGGRGDVETLEVLLIEIFI